jgi:hypothetical protein
MRDLKKEIDYLMIERPTVAIALCHHRTHKNARISLKNYPYLTDIYLDQSDHIVIEKSTQCGLSEFLIVFMISEGMIGRSTFYVLPTEVIRSRFIKNRVDKSIAYTPFYKKLIADGSSAKVGSGSVSLKNIGKAAIAFVGSNSAAGFTEFPADTLIIDEYDRCDQENLPMAWERLSAAQHKKVIEISNPTIENYGIDIPFAKSDRKQWNLKCDHCGKWIIPDFFKHIVLNVGEQNWLLRDRKWTKELKRDIYLICDCGKPIDRFKDGSWVPTIKSNISGRHINKLFSTNVTIQDLIDRFEKGLVNDTDMQRFYNGDLGLPYTAEGAKISKKMLDNCIQDYLMPSTTDRHCTMGVDVGSMLHVVIYEILPTGGRAVYIGSVKNPGDIIRLYHQYNVKVGVIDGLPEQRLSDNLVAALPGMYKCFYSRDAKKSAVDYKKKIITVDRTSSMDAVKESIILKQKILPKNAASLSEYYDHMQAPVRIFDENKQRYIWAEGSKADHLFHAEVYASVARRLILSML